MAYKLKGFRIAEESYGALKTKPGSFAVQATTNRSGAICPGKLVVISATAGKYDGWIAGDSVVAGSRKILGMCKKILDSTGRIADVQYLGTGDAGFIEVYDLNGVTLLGTEDGAGTPDTISAGGSIAGISGTITNYLTTGETPFPTPESNDLLDSSEFAADTTTNVFIVDGLDPRPDNTTTNGQTWRFHIISSQLLY